MRTLLGIVAGALAVAGTAGAASPTPTISACGKQVRSPKQLTIACGDGNYYLRDLRWSPWGGATVSASGVAVVNDCTPYCAAGRFHAYPVKVTLGHVIRCGRRSRYGLALVLFTGPRPRGYARTVPTTFTCRY